MVIMPTLEVEYGEVNEGGLKFNVQLLEPNGKAEEHKAHLISAHP
jgi:hypothetical protein